MSEIKFSKSWDRHAQKWANFKRMRDARLPKAIKAIELIGNLSNRSSYDYEETEAIEIVRKLQSAIDTLAKAYRIPVNPVDKAPERPAAAPDIEQLEASNPSTWWIKWALDCINRGQIDDAKEHLKTALGRKESDR